MEIYHKVNSLNNNRYVTIYVTYPDEYEFSLDFDAFKKNVKDVSNNIKQYISENFKKAKDTSFVLVLNGILVGTLLLSNIIPSNANQTYTNIPTQIEATQTRNTTNTDNDQIANNKEETIAPQSAEIAVPENTEANIQENNTVIPNNNSKNNTNSGVTTQKNATNNVTTTPPAPTPTPKPAENNNPQDRMINLKLSSGQIISIGLEEYVTGVVSSEMPASFSTEALKAQAVAARTYALKKIEAGSTLTATKSDQVYKTKDELQKMWGGSYNTYYSKVNSAVLATKGEVIKYSGKYIDALYFSTSNGKTEDPIFVWGNSSPYLKSVNSNFDVGVSGYISTKTLTLSQISNKLGVSLSGSSTIKVVNKTTGNRVKTAIFGNKEFTGVEIRNSLGLRSADFDISVSGSNVTFTCRGYGHGVGMSQYGANEMAKQGYSYKDILKHYYTGVNIVKA